MKYLRNFDLGRFGRPGPTQGCTGTRLEWPRDVKLGCLGRQVGRLGHQVGGSGRQVGRLERHVGSLAGHLKTIGQRSRSSNRARSGRRHDRQQSNGPLAKHNREQSGPPCNRAIGSPAQSIPSVDHAGRPESCNEYDRALSGNCHNLVQSGSRSTSQGAIGPCRAIHPIEINRALGAIWGKAG